MSELFDITTVMHEDRVFYPTSSGAARAHVPDAETYERLYTESINDPEGFWGRQAEVNLDWYKPWDSVLKYDFSQIGKGSEPFVQFFSGGKLNVSYNCLDRHLTAERRNKTAYIWQGDNETERRTLTYEQLHNQVCRFANVLKKQGIVKGDRVAIFMPMVPELPVAMLACARIGAVHSVVFSGLSAPALKSRVIDCGPKAVITANAAYHGGKVIDIKSVVDEALAECPDVKKVIVYERVEQATPMTAGRDLWWHEETAVPDISDTCEPEIMDAEDPLFILYTSGSTGKPKGVIHTTAGYLLHAQLSHKIIFDIKEDDVYWCTADIGWITGHSYIVYGPLANGTTSIMFEGIPTHPQPDRFWKLVAEQKVSIFYTAPTAIRALMRFGDEWPAKHDLSSLRLLGSVGEPINPEAWIWYYKTIGGERCPIVDTWWQTESGGIMISPLTYLPEKPGSAARPFFGVAPLVIKSDGAVAGVNEGGSLVITKPWPGMLRGLFGDTNHEHLKEVYFSVFPGMYFTGDGCRIDDDGYYWIMGRIDDVINVSAHRFSTAEIESALVSHPLVVEAAVVGMAHEIKGQAIYCFVTLKQGIQSSPELKKELIAHVRKMVGPIAAPEEIQFADALPKTRSGKIMRRILRKIADGDIASIGDTSTLADPSTVDTLIRERNFV